MENNQEEMKIYSSKESNNYTTLINPSLKDIIPLVQVGDVLTYTGHTFLIYESDNKYYWFEHAFEAQKGILEFLSFTILLRKAYTLGPGSLPKI